jgi:short-subunit dehydrogenase
MNLDDCNTLITGASAGLGREFAGQLAGRAKSLVLVARRLDRLEELANELQTQNPNLVVHTRAVDLSDSKQLDDFVNWLEQNRITIDFLINNAGLGDVGAFATSDEHRDDEMLLVNVVALTKATRRVLPQMMARKRGAILNVSSSASFLPIPGFAIYAATKAYVTSFSEALRAELRGSGITVTTLCPGPVDTEFQTVAQRAGGKPDSAPGFVYVSAEQVVRDALYAVEQDKPLIIPGLFMKISMFLVRITPLPILRLVWRLGPRRSTR